MREHNIKEIIAELSDERLFSNLNNNEDRRAKIVSQLMYFFCDGKEILINNIKEQSDEKQKIIIRNINKMWPFSKEVILLMLKNYDMKKARIVNHFEDCEEILAIIHEVYKKIDGGNSIISQDLSQKQEQINDLGKEVEKLKNQINGLKATDKELEGKHKEVEELEKELKELQIKNNEYKNDDYVDKLKKQVEKLKDDNLNHKEKIKELETELAKHKEDSKQFSDAWKKLRECIKNIDA